MAIVERAGIRWPHPRPPRAGPLPIGAKVALLLMTTALLLAAVLRYRPLLESAAEVIGAVLAVAVAALLTWARLRRHETDAGIDAWIARNAEVNERPVAEPLEREQAGA